MNRIVFRPIHSLSIAVLLLHLLTGCSESNINQCIRLEDMLRKQENQPDIWNPLYPVQSRTQEEIAQLSNVYNQVAENLKKSKFQDEKLKLFQNRLINQLETSSQAAQVITTPNSDQIAVRNSYLTLVGGTLKLNGIKKDVEQYCDSLPIQQR